MSCQFVESHAYDNGVQQQVNPDQQNRHDDRFSESIKKNCAKESDQGECKADLVFHKHGRKRILYYVGGSVSR